MILWSSPKNVATLLDYRLDEVFSMFEMIATSKGRAGRHYARRGPLQQLSEKHHKRLEHHSAERSAYNLV